MKNKIAGLVMMLWAVMVCLEGAPAAFAREHGGEGKGGMPAGFSQGQKKGWGNEKTPPGWSHGKKKGWGDTGGPVGLFGKKPKDQEAPVQPPAQG